MKKIAGDYQYLTQQAIHPVLGDHVADFDVEGIADKCFAWDANVDGYVQIHEMTPELLEQFDNTLKA